MDELLALMEESGEEEAVPVSSPSHDSCQTEQKQSDVEATAAATSSRHHSSSESRSPTQQTSTSQAGRAEASVDDRVGIRMIQRNLSSIDLLDLISSNPYHSTAALCAMGRATLNRLLQEPATVVDEATVCGKTAIVTVGIVFTNSGTRISLNGRAFCVMTIGNLNTGPVVSVFLFGEAYSNHCAKCTPGSVIALVTPSLMSPKGGSRDSMALSFSVADPRQLVYVARARDYALCKATVSTKRADGKWVSNGGRCKHHVDIRVSLYCQQHRKQQNVKNGPTKQQPLTFMQQQRLQHGPKLALATKGAMTMDTPRGVVVVHNPKKSRLEAQLDACQPRTRSLNVHIKKQGTAAHLPSGRNASAQLQQAGRTSRLEAQLNACRPCATALKVPMHVKKQGTASQLTSERKATAQLQQQCSRTNNRPPLKRVQKAAGKHKQDRASTARGVAVQHDWLSNPKGSKPAAATSGKKKRAINRDAGGFDGSVAVPKPSKLFRGKSALVRHQQVSNVEQQQGPSQAEVDSIREKQRLVAERQKQDSLSTKLSKKRPEASDDALKESLFGKFKSMDTEKVLSAKSRFADEADAEAYARSRQTVADLERREESKTKKKKTVKESSIQKEWVCATCNRTSKTRLDICIRAKHKVSYKRDLKKAATVEEKRLMMGGKSAQDGGIVLGAGLEWDRRRHPF